jgi:hypothetical protein
MARGKREEMLNRDKSDVADVLQNISQKDATLFVRSPLLTVANLAVSV